jgi:predicted GNAT family acetyltransferase
VSDEPLVRRNDELSRYEILVGDDVGGFTEYAMHGRQIDLLHTEVASKFEGHGLASRLIGAILDDVRARGLTAMPYCPFVRAFIGKHEEYLDLVPAEHRGKFGL